MVFFLGGLLGFFKIYFFLKFCRALKFLLAWVMFLEHLLSRYWECLSNYSWIDQTITVLNLMNISYHYFQQILNLYVPTHTPTFFFFLLVLLLNLFKYFSLFMVAQGHQRSHDSCISHLHSEISFYIDLSESLQTNEHFLQTWLWQ